MGMLMVIKIPQPTSKRGLREIKENKCHYCGMNGIGMSNEKSKK